MRKGLARQRFTAWHAETNRKFVIEIVPLPPASLQSPGALRAAYRYQTKDGHDVMRLAEGRFWIPHLNLEVIVGKSPRRSSSRP
jgi:hypothetical protein